MQIKRTFSLEPQNTNRRVLRGNGKFQAQPSNALNVIDSSTRLNQKPYQLSNKFTDIKPEDHWKPKKQGAIQKKF